MECWASFLTFTFGTTRTVELSAARAGRTLPSTKFFGTHFFQTLSRPPSLLNADRRIKSAWNLQNHTGNRIRSSRLVAQCLSQLRNRLLLECNSNVQNSMLWVTFHTYLYFLQKSSILSFLEGFDHGSRIQSQSRTTAYTGQRMTRDCDNCWIICVYNSLIF